MHISMYVVRLERVERQRYESIWKIEHRRSNERQRPMSQACRIRAPVFCIGTPPSPGYLKVYV